MLDEGEADPENLAHLNAQAAEFAERFDPCPVEAFAEFERDELVAITERCSRSEARRLPEHEYNFLLRVGAARREAERLEAESQESEREGRKREGEYRQDSMFG